MLLLFRSRERSVSRRMRAPVCIPSPLLGLHGKFFTKYHDKVERFLHVDETRSHPNSVAVTEVAETRLFYLTTWWSEAARGTVREERVDSTESPASGMTLGGHTPTTYPGSSVFVTRGSRSPVELISLTSHMMKTQRVLSSSFLIRKMIRSRAS